MTTAVATVDLGAIGRNLARVRERAGSAALMAVVKADGYGHGMAQVARAARGRGVEWLAVAHLSEAVSLRESGDSGPVLAWLWTPGDPLVAACVVREVDLSVSSGWALDEVCAAARATGRVARVHVKVDTGLSRNGVAPDDWSAVFRAVASNADAVELVGVWSHLADGDVPGASTAAAQRDRLASAVELARGMGLTPPVVHLANSGAVWAHPDMHLDLVRTGIAMYGLTPSAELGTAADLGLTPAMTLRTALANVKSVPAGARVSYGGTWTTPVPTRLGLVPVGYADGIPRVASGSIEVAISGRRFPQVGRVAMDQFVIDLGETDAYPGDEVVIFGPGSDGELTADEIGQRIGTIGYEIVTRIGPRVAHDYLPDRPGG